MPDWNSKELVKIKQFVVRYTQAMNDKKVDRFKQVFHKNAIMHRAMENFQGLPAIIKWHAKAWDSQGFRHAAFALKDASTGIFPDGSAKCILWYEITVPKGSSKGTAHPKIKSIHIESLDLKLCGNKWKVTRCFGMGYDPNFHAKYFKDT